MIKHILLSFLISILLLNPFNEKVLANNVQPSEPPSHQIWTELLQEHVTEDGMVDYKGFRDDKDKLLSYTKRLSDHPPADNWTENEKKAYLINTYNAFTVLLIVDNYPLESIKDIGGFLSSPFSKKFIKIGKDTYSLNDVEKGMLLKMGDARVHFAVNCASFSCPKLENEAFIPSRLDQQLNKATKVFLRSDKNQVSEDELRLSKIFKWYASDFKEHSGSVINFINEHIDKNIPPDMDTDHLDYDWSLNEK